MNLRRFTAVLILLTALIASSTAYGQRAELFAKRGTVAISYPENDGTSVDIVGTALNPRASGKAEVKRSDGRTRVKLDIDNLDNPLGLAGYYTTYVLWAIAPEGQADNLGELPVTLENKREIEFTTPYKTFGLIVTAEPHGLVKLPSPAVVAENILRKNTKGGITSSQIEYRGDPGSLYLSEHGPASPATGIDYSTPLAVLGARRAVEIARRAHAQRFAEAELRESEVRLAALEQIWPRHRGNEKRFTGEAHEVMRLAEQARALAVEREEQARLDAERRAASSTISRAQSEADRARSEAYQAKNEAERAKTDADRARQETEDYRDALRRSETDLAAARQRVEQAQSDADRAKANEDLARIQAENAKLEAEQARRERDSAQQRLFISLSEILETRREARGLIVSLSDVLFDFDKATLKPGAKEKLSKLSGILLAYPGAYRMEIEGHTDAIGSADYNVKLSEARANSVKDYLAQAGIDSGRITAVRGLGKTRPVTTNDTPEGRQMNRRVEIVIADQEKP
ncbi:MAG TPA: OmpA family protein [Blastocatellia bacterium]|nr:OmpA family protein [Blastocatellia bacterium]